MMKIPTIFLFSLCLHVTESNTNNQTLPEYLIIGAGGSGLQLALYFEKFGLTYSILEKEAVVGSFWTKFPTFKELISVNKFARNESQRMRYDWHSMPEAPVQMGDVTCEYFPTGDDWHKYMDLVAKEANITHHIEFNTEIESLASDATPCVVLKGGEKRCASRRVFLGTGLKQKDEPFLEALGGTPYSQVTKEMARGRRVCILGNGNSGFELAQNILSVAEQVFIHGRTAPRLSSVTKYTGDVRIKYLQIMENFHAKLLDTITWHEPPLLQHASLDRSQQELYSMLTDVIFWLHLSNCEAFFVATGVSSHVPRGMPSKRRFPATSSWYQSIDNPNVHYIGWLMHERDFRRGAGGFLSGFRYLIRNLAHCVREQDEGITYPFYRLTEEEVASKVVSRIQVADDLVILQDGVTIRDAIAPVTEEPGMYHYYEGITFDFHSEISEREDVMYLYFAWGDSRTTSGVFDSIYHYADTHELLNKMLHPVIQIGNLTREILEDIDMDWKSEIFHDPIRRLMFRAMAGDLTGFVPKVEHQYIKPLLQNKTNPADLYITPDEGPHYLNKSIRNAILHAVISSGKSASLKRLEESMRAWMPDLFDWKQTNDAASEVA